MMKKFVALFSHGKKNVSRGSWRRSSIGTRRERSMNNRGATERAKSVEKGGRERERGRSKSFCGFATQAGRKIRNEWRSDTMQRSQGDTSKRPPISATPFRPLLSPPPRAEPLDIRTIHLEWKKKGRRKGAKKGADKRARRREEAGRFKESIDAWPETGWWATSLFFSLYRDQSCVRGRKGIEWKGSACDGSRESVTSHGDSLVPPLFHRCPPTNSLDPCSLLKERNNETFSA